MHLLCFFYKDIWLLWFIFKTRDHKRVDDKYWRLFYSCFLGPFTWARGSRCRALGKLWVSELQGCGLPHDFIWLGAFSLRPWGTSVRHSAIHYMLVIQQRTCFNIIASSKVNIFLWRSLAWTHLPHIWEAKHQENHSESGPVPQEVQWNSVLGDHRDVSVLSARQKGATSQEVHQDCCPVSVFAACFLLTQLVVLFIRTYLFIFSVIVVRSTGIWMPSLLSPWD